MSGDKHGACQCRESVCLVRRLLLVLVCRVASWLAVTDLGVVVRGLYLGGLVRWGFVRGGLA